MASEDAQVAKKHDMMVSTKWQSFLKAADRERMSKEVASNATEQVSSVWQCKTRKQKMLTLYIAHQGSLVLETN